MTIFNVLLLSVHNNGISNSIHDLKDQVNMVKITLLVR